MAGLMRSIAPNGHGKYATPDNETGHARFPDEPTSHSTRLLKDSNQVAGYLPIPLPQAGEGAYESLREFHVKIIAHPFGRATQPSDKAASHSTGPVSNTAQVTGYAPCLLLGVLCLLMPVLGCAEDFSDPTRPPSVAAGAPAAGTTVAAPVEKSGLDSIIISKNRRAAILDGQTVELGGKHGDAKLIEIAPDRVVLQTAHGRQVKMLFPDVKKTGKQGRVVDQLPAKKPVMQKDNQ